MSWTDGLDDSDGLLPFLGISGAVIFGIVCLITFYNHKDIMRDGILVKVVEIGTCRDGKCVIRVQGPGAVIMERETGSRVFIGDQVKCGERECYKD